MDLPCDKMLPSCDNMMAALFDDDSGLGMEFDFRNDGTHSPVKAVDEPICKRKRRFSPQTGTYSRQSADIRSTVQSQTSAALDNDDVIGDGSRTCRLPTVFDSRHDLKCISPETLADVLTGSTDIGAYVVIDCRYPYEYNGGHVTNASNLYKTDDISTLLTDSTNSTPTVLIFHCEFSIERGPSMCRHLRQKDREVNAENYPYLNYPEIYLLQGGYKDFFNKFPELCTPEGYTPMLHKKHAEELRHFRCKSKSWTFGQNRKTRKTTRLLDF